MNLQNYEDVKCQLKDINDLLIGDIIYDRKHEKTIYVVSCFSDFIQDEVSCLAFNSNYLILRKKIE